MVDSKPNSFRFGPRTQKPPISHRRMVLVVTKLRLENNILSRGGIFFGKSDQKRPKSLKRLTKSGRRFSFCFTSENGLTKLFFIYLVTSNTKRNLVCGTQKIEIKWRKLEKAINMGWVTGKMFTYAHIQIKQEFTFGSHTFSEVRKTINLTKTPKKKNDSDRKWLQMKQYQKKKYQKYENIK